MTGATVGKAEVASPAALSARWGAEVVSRSETAEEEEDDADDEDE